MDALANAFADVDRMHASAVATVCKSPGRMLTGGAIPLNRPKLARAKEQYSHFSGWTFVAIRAIASRIAGQSLFVARISNKPSKSRKLQIPKQNFLGTLKGLGDRLEPLQQHPLLDAIENPNPIMTRWPLMFSTAASLLLTGRSYWWVTDTDDGLTIWPIPSNWMEPGDPLRGTWKLKPYGGIDEYELSSEDVAAFVFPDPSNPFSSVSPLQAQALAVTTDEQIQASQHAAFVNGINPGMMIRVGRLPGMAMGTQGERPVLEPEQRQEIIDAVLNWHGGTANRQNPMIVDGMIEGVERLTNSIQEMDFLDSGKQTKSRILQSFGLSPFIVGEIENGNRAQAVVAEQNFCQNINPLIELMSEGLTRWVGNRFSENQKLMVWIEPCRANDPEQKLAEWKTARANGDVTPNEYRTHVLNLPSIAGGDELRDSLGNPIGATT